MRPLGRRLWGFGFGLCFGLWQNRSRSRRGGKVGISRLWRDFQGSVGAGGNLLLVFAGLHAPAFSTALLCRGRAEFLTVAVELSHYVRPVTDRHRLVEVFVYGDGASGQAGAKSCFFDLPPPVLDSNRVVLFHHPLSLYCENPVQLAPAGSPKRRAFFCRRHAELRVELPDVPL